MNLNTDLSLFCLFDLKSPAIVFKRVQSKKSEFCVYKCKLQGLDLEGPAKLDQLMFFTQGEWGENLEGKSIDISIDGHDGGQNLCSLTSSQRCLQWTRKTTDDFESLSSAKSITLIATIKGLADNDVSVEDKSKEQKTILSSTPVMKKTTTEECEDMKKVNETTPQFETSEVKSPSTAKAPKKRRKDEETTPKPKSRRQKVAMRALSSEKTPPSKHKLGEIPSPNGCVNSKGPGMKNGPEVKATRCVDLSARAPKPSNRWGHTMCLVSSKQAVLIGGQGEKQLSRDSVWILDPEMRSWKCPDVVTEGAKPEYRVGHSATYDPTMRCIYIYGGSKNAKWFHDVHMFDLDEKKWTLVKANGKAPTRAYHTATLYRHELWIFGGVFPRPDPQPDGCDNEIQIFSPIMESWYKPIVTGDKPQPRSGHSATLINDLLVIFGGWDFPYCYNDLFILDLTTVDWSTPKVFGKPPKPRSWHASCSLTHERIFIHGGYDGDNALHDAFIFSLESKTWQELVLENAPSARAGHSCLRLPSNYENQDEDEIIVFGGGDNDGSYYSDMLSFYVPFKPRVVECSD